MFVCDSRVIKISSTHAVELSSKYNMHDGSHYHAISLQKYKRDAYDCNKKVMTGKVVLDMPLGIQAVENCIAAMTDLVREYKELQAEYEAEDSRPSSPTPTKSGRKFKK
jgi:hypothetical protein